MCGWSDPARFPGSQPVSLDRSNLTLLLQEPYTVSWKADGTRYLMAILSSGVYLTDRDYRIFKTNLHFPDRALVDEAVAAAKRSKQLFGPMSDVCAQVCASCSAVLCD